MITETKLLKFKGNSSNQIRYTITSDLDCMTISPNSGTVNANDIVEFTFTLSNTDCYNALITVVAEELTGSNFAIACSRTTTFNLTNSCNNLLTSVTHQTVNRSVLITATTVGGTPDYTYEFFYDTQYYNLITINDNVLSISLKPNIEVPNTSNVTVVTTDAKGCSVTTEYSFNICKPVAQDKSIALSCVPSYTNAGCTNIIAQLTNTPLIVSTCGASSIDWDTLVINLPDGFCYSNNANLISIFADSTVTPGDYTFSYTVQNAGQILSNTANINVNVPLCAITADPPFIPSTEAIVLAPTDTTGTVKEFNVEALVDDPSNYDWDSFTFIAATGQTLVAADSLTSTNGDVVYTCDRKIEYTVDTQNCNLDLIQFTIDDKDGNTSNIGKLVIDYENFPAPTVANGAFNVGGFQNNTLNVLTSSTGNIDVSTVNIVSSPTEGNATVNADGTITYYTTSSATSDSFTFNAVSKDGLTSNTGTATLTIQNTGIAKNEDICPVSGINLFNYITNYTTGGTWTASGSNPTVINVASPTNCNFSSATVGTDYTFTYTIGSFSTDIVLTILDSDITITSVTAPTSNGLVSGNPTSTIRFTGSGITNSSNIEIEIDFSSGTAIYTYPPDFWSGRSGTVTVEFPDGAGTYDITVTATDQCGNSINDTDSVTIA
jgi:hypothetical protein